MQSQPTFFVQAEDGIRDYKVTGVQTCALPIYGNTSTCTALVTVEDNVAPTAICQNIAVQLGTNGMVTVTAAQKIGRASCRERVEISEDGVAIQKQTK